MQPSRRTARSFPAPWLFWAITVVTGCPSRHHGTDERRTASSAAPEPELPSRAEVVAQADALSVQAAAKGGADGAGLMVRAAVLRRRVYRVEGVRGDALEAVELFRGASRAAWDGACDAEIDGALLQGEIEADPAGEYRALYAA